MLSGSRLKPGISPRIPFTFTSIHRPSRNRCLEVAAAAKGRGAPKRGGAKKDASAPSKSLFGGLFSSTKKAAANPKQAAKKVKKAVTPPKRAAAVGTRKIGGGTKKIGTKRVGGTARIGTKRVGGTSKIGTKRVGSPRAAAPPKRIQLDEETSTSLGAAGVFSLGLAASAFLLFSAFTGIEGPAEAEQVAQVATKSVQNAIQGASNEITSIAESSATEDENTKVADLAQKAQEAAGKIPSQARSAASPIVADSAPTGQAGSGLSEQSPSGAEDTQIPSVIQESKEKVEGTTTFSGLFGFLSPKVNEVSNVADSSIEQQAKEVAGDAAAAAGKPAQAVESALGSVPAPDPLSKEAVEKPGEAVKGADGNRAATPTGMKGSVTNLADTGIKPGSAFQASADKLSASSEEQYLDRQVADKKIQKADDFEANAAFKKSSPGSAGGNSTIGRDEKQITNDPTATPQPKPLSFDDSAQGVVPGNAASKANEVSSTSEVSPGEDENTKIADLAKKAQSAAQEVPSDARSAPAPQVADATPTGQAGAGLGEQSPSAAEDSQIPGVIQESKEKVEGSKPFGGLFGFLSPKVNEVSSTAELSPGEDENTKIADLAEKAQSAAQQIPSDARSAPAPQVADAAPTGQAGAGLGEQSPGAAEDSQIPGVIQESKEKVEGSTTFSGLFGFLSPKVNEVSSTADVSPGEDENSKIADLAQKAQSAAQEVPSDARSAPAPQVADAAPTGQAGAGLGEQSPGAAEDSQIPGVIQDSKEKVEGSTTFSGLFGFLSPKVNEVSSTAALSPGEDENTKIADLAEKAQSAAQEVPSDARSAAAPQVADAAPTGNAGAGLGEQSPSGAEDSQIPAVIQESKEKVEGSTTFSGLFGFLSPKVNEASNIAENPVEDAAQAVAGNAESAADKVKEATEDPVEAAKSAADNVPDEPVKEVKRANNGIFGFIGKKAEEAANTVNVDDAAKEVTANAESALDKAKDVADAPKEAVNEAAQSVPVPDESVKETAKDAGKGFFGFLAPKAEEAAKNVNVDDAAKEVTANAESALDKAKDVADAPKEAVNEAAQSVPVPDESVKENAKDAGKGFFGFLAPKAEEAVDKLPTGNESVEGAAKEVGKEAEKAADKAVEAAEKPAEAVEAAAEKVPAPDPLPKESVEKPGEAVKGADGFRASTPTGMEGLVTNLADTGLKRSDAFEEAAKKLRSSSAEQFKQAQETDKEIQAQDDIKRAAAFKQGFPGSAEGNSVIGRDEKQITNDPTATPQPKPFSFDQSDSGSVPGAAANKNPAQAGNAKNNNLLLIGGAVIVAGIFGLASQQPGGIEGAAEEVTKAAESASKEADKAADGVKKEVASSGGSVADDIASRKEDAKKWISEWKSASGSTSENGASGGETGDVKADIADRKKDAQKWISDWKSSTGGK